MEEQLRRAVFEGNLPTVQRILQQQPGGVNVNAGIQASLTALHVAVWRGDFEIVQAIVRASGVNLNARDNSGITPLHMTICFAYSHARLPVFQALLEAGADPNAVDDDGRTPLFFAAGLEDKTVAEALLDGGANPAVRNNNLDTPLHQACNSGGLDVVKLFIQRQGPECLTLKNNREETPLDVVRSHSLSKKEAVASIRKHILQAYAGMLAQRDGLLCLHSVLQDAAFIEGDDDKFQLPVGKLITEHLQSLLEYIIAMEPGSVRALNSDGLIPVQYASELNFPASVLYVLLRPYPNMLVHTSLPSNPEVKRESSANRSKQRKPRKLQRI